MFQIIKKILNCFRLYDCGLIFIIIVFSFFSLVVCSENPHVKLSSDVIPLNYDLHLDLDLDNETFDGHVTIKLRVFKMQQAILIHSKYLFITSAKLSKSVVKNDTLVFLTDLRLERFSVIEEFDQIEVRSLYNIKPADYRLYLEFNGTMSNDDRGLFIIKHYDAETGENKKIAVTQFEPIYARQVFPCFDEPQFRSIFDITISHRTMEGYQILSNMPVEDTKHEGNRTIVRFQRSFPIPTYLVGFVVTDFIYRTALVPARWDHYVLIPITTWTTVEKFANLDLVLHMGYRALDLYMHIFRQNYPLPKIDLVALPQYVSEPSKGWGLLLYNEPSMLYFPRLNSIDELKTTTELINYGLVEMWFGNLVTMKWWSDTWLVKSFATFMQYYTTQWGFSDWKELECFIIEQKYPSMMKDYMLSSLPIVQHSLKPEKIRAYLNSIFKDKGASLIWMLYHMMGEKNFFYGIASFLQVYQFNVADSEDFFSSMQRFHDPKEHIDEIFDTWILQSGFPVLNVVCDKNVYYINQTRFTIKNDSTYEDLTRSPFSYKWDVPILYTTNVLGPPKTIFFSHEKESIELAVDHHVKWIKFNSNSAGYFTVNYDVEMWHSFIELLQKTPLEFGVLDTVDLLNDAFLNAYVGNIPYEIPLNMTMIIQYHGSYTIWKFVSIELLGLYSLIRNTEISKRFEVYVQRLVYATYLLVQWDTNFYDPYEKSRLRLVILKTACTFGAHLCIKEVSNRFKTWLQSPEERPHPDIREIIYYYGMLNAGDKKTWELVFKLFLMEPNVQERRRLMISLTAIQDSDVLTEYLERAKNSSLMSSEEYLTTIQAAAMNPISPTLMWNYYRHNWNYLSTRYRNEDKNFADLIISVTNRFHDEKMYSEVSEFMKRNPHRSSDEERREALEVIQNNIFWMEKNYKQVQEWLEK